MRNRIKAAGIAGMLLAIGIASAAYAPTIAPVSTAQAQTEYLPTERISSANGASQGPQSDHRVI
ncbi:hypothetical protein [Mesorhizobium sp. M0772]|uniref:hypothetical protein n=1 Tax=Mesorhizobium sp. M0772 TaxID=2956998 RepID=UPI003339B4BD